MFRSELMRKKKTPKISYKKQKTPDFLMPSYAWSRRPISGAEPAQAMSRCVTAQDKSRERLHKIYSCSVAECENRVK